MSQPKLNDARRILVDAQQQLEKYERSLINLQASCENERSLLDQLRAETAKMRAHAAEDAQNIRAAARADADRLAQDTKASLADAIKQRKIHTETAETILREAQEKAEMALEKNTQEMVDLVSGLAFLRKEIDRLTIERDNLSEEITRLAGDREQLDGALGALQKRFETIGKGMK